MAQLSLQHRGLVKCNTADDIPIFLSISSIVLSTVWNKSQLSLNSSAWGSGSIVTWSLQISFIWLRTIGHSLRRTEFEWASYWKSSVINNYCTYTLTSVERSMKGVCDILSSYYANVHQVSLNYLEWIRSWVARWSSW